MVSVESLQSDKAAMKFHQVLHTLGMDQVTVPLTQRFMSSPIDAIAVWAVIEDQDKIADVMCTSAVI